MFPGIGTLINVVAIIGGAGLGIFVDIDSASKQELSSPMS
jgi:hypothetical protein